MRHIRPRSCAAFLFAARDAVPLTLTVRAADRGDLAAVDALLARAYPRLLKPDYPASVLVTALPIISRARPELVTCGTYFVAVADAQIVGAGGWTHTGGGVAEVRHLVADDRRPRQGIGRAIIEQVFLTASEAGVTSFTCLSTRTAVPFFTAMGFRVIGPQDVALRPGIVFPAIRMQRSL